MKNNEYKNKSIVKIYFKDLRINMDLYNKKLFIFDLDGTLVDTAPDFKNSLNYMLTEINEETIELDEIRNLVGYGARELIRRTAYFYFITLIILMMIVYFLRMLKMFYFI